jgi:hypothetical protein
MPPGSGIEIGYTNTSFGSTKPVSGVYDSCNQLPLGKRSMCQTDVHQTKKIPAADATGICLYKGI